MMELKVFNNTEFGNIRTLERDGQPWFVGKDVAEILGYGKARNALTTHVDSDDALKQGLTDSMGRTQETIIINESGLYSLILSSKMPKAKQFKRWVTNEVLPSIRKHGVYATQELLNNPDILIDALQNLKAERERNEHLSLQTAQQAQIIGELQPKANYVDRVLQCKSLMTTTQIAKDYGMSAHSMNIKLKELGVQYKQSGQWLLYSKYHNKGYTHSETISLQHKDGTPFVRLETKWTQKGRLFLYELLKKQGTSPMIEQNF